jgi:hypothetical protein
VLELLKDLFGSRVRESVETAQNWGSDLEPQVELDRKAVIYKDLEGLERGEAIRLLNEIVLEQLAQDPTISMDAIKKATPGFQNAMLNLNWTDVAFLSALAIEYYLKASIFSDKKDNPR